MGIWHSGFRPLSRYPYLLTVYAHPEVVSPHWTALYASKETNLKESQVDTVASDAVTPDSTPGTPSGTETQGDQTR